jgi:acyl carrier protein
MTAKHNLHLTEENREMEVKMMIYRLLSNLFGITIEDQQDLKEDLQADELDFVEIVLSLETLFTIHISDEELKELATLSKVVDVVEYAKILVLSRIQIVSTLEKNHQGK